MNSIPNLLCCIVLLLPQIHNYFKEMLAEFGNFLLPLLYKTWQTKPIPLQGNSVGATVLSVKHEHAEWVHYLILVILCVENGHQKSSSFTWCGVLIKHASLNNLCKKKQQHKTQEAIQYPFHSWCYFIG